MPNLTEGRPSNGMVGAGEYTLPYRPPKAPRRKLDSALLVTGWAALVGTLAALLPPGSQWDGLQLWLGARALLAGQDPYSVVPHGFPYQLYYPLPAVLLAVPLAWLPQTGARIAWAALTGGAFAYAFRSRPQLLACLSAPFLVALVLGQLSPALMAGAVVPSLGFLWAAKPSVGLALFLAYPSRKAITGGVMLVALSLAVMPSWPAHWLAALGSMPQKAPVVLPGGFVLLLAWLRWRTPEGRLLGSLALIPHGGYDGLVLFLLARSRREVLLLSVSTMLGMAVAAIVAPWHPGGNVADPRAWVCTLVTLYLPALGLVLYGSHHERDAA